jgi:hypothetical protein
MIWVLLLLLVPMTVYTAEEQIEKIIEEERRENEEASQKKLWEKVKRQLQDSQYLPTGYSGQQIKIQCSDIEEPLDVPLELAQTYSITLKNFIEDIGGDHPIPILSTANTVKCLMAFAKKLYESKPRNELTDARKTFQEIMQAHTSNNQKENFELDLLLQANYLDFNTDVYDQKYELFFPFKSLVASLYADSLSARPPSFGELPTDLYRLVAGWLLHNLLLKQLPISRAKDFTFGDLTVNPIMSSSGSHTSFACVWSKLPSGNTTLGPQVHDHYYLLINLENDSIKNDRISNIRTGSLCALSQDNKYLITTETLIRDLICNLYPLYNTSMNQILSLRPPTEYYTSDTVAALFDNTHSVFKIITQNKLKDKTYTSYCHTITPTSTYELNQKSINNAEPITKETYIGRRTYYWSCINGKLIALNEHVKDRVFIIDKTLITLYFDPKRIYSGNADFDIVTTTIQGNDEDRKESPIRIAIHPSCIPAFGKIVSEKLQNTIKALSAYQIKPTPERITTQFDPNHLHMNFIVSDDASKDSKIGIYYPCDPNLLAAINALNKEAFTNPNNPQLLFTAYFLQEFYNHPDTWKERRKAFTSNILPEVQEIYNFPRITPKYPYQLGYEKTMKQQYTPIYPYQQEYEKTMKQLYAYPYADQDLQQEEDTKTTKQQATPEKHIPKKTSRTTSLPPSSLPPIPLPNTPLPTSFWGAFKQGKFWEYTKQQWQPILGGAAFVAGASTLGAWLWNKYGRQWPTQSKISGAHPRTP